MSQYIVSARKYRPDSFETLIGQDNIALTLKNSILRGQLAHAYLFCGPRGVGKTTTARIFAKMINCSSPSSEMEPCGQCESCLSFAEGRSYCIHELDAASNNGVDDIKALMDQVRIPPQVGKYSVYIIDEVHMLSQSAFNAFLKTLEEPPAHAIFILATTEKHKILPTILSRCQTYDFNRITVENIVRNLRMVASKEEVSIDDESLHVIAHKADGAMRDALTIFDQTIAFCGTDVKYQDVLRNLNVLDYEYSFSLIEAFQKGDYSSAFLTFDEILTKGFNALHFVAALSSHLRDLIVSKSGGMDALLELPESLKKRYKEQAEKCSITFLYEALTITAQCESGYRASINPRLHIEFALMKLSLLTSRQSASASQTTVQPAVQTPASTVPASAAPALQARPSDPVVQPAVSKAVTVQTQQTAAESISEAQPRERRARSSRVASTSLSMKAILDSKPQQVSETISDEPAPSDDTLKEKWPELSKIYNDKPRLASLLSTTSISISGDEQMKTIVFNVSNQAQKDWVESKLLHELEGRFRGIVNSSKVSLKVELLPDDSPQEKKIYMPSEQVKTLMAQNDEIVSLIKDFELDIK